MGQNSSIGVGQGSGIIDNQVLVLIDGVPVNSVMLGLADVSAISAAQVERIEVLRGPFSALYDSGALGGVISITTAKPGGPEVSARAGGRPEVGTVCR